MSKNNLGLVLLKLFENEIDFPEILSREWNLEDKPVIRFEWKDGRVKEIPYTPDDFDKALTAFNEYWRGINGRYHEAVQINLS